VIASVSGAMSVSSGSSLIRTAFVSQAAVCDKSVLTSGDEGGGMFAVDIGATDAAGHGYRSALVSLLIVVACGAGIGACVAVWLRKRYESWSSAVAAAAFPGWWLCGPCSTAVAPIISGAVALLSVADWATPVADGLLLVVSLAVAIGTVALCALAVLPRSVGGWFAATTCGAAPSCVESSPNAVMGIVKWLGSGGYLWHAAPCSATPTIIDVHPLSFGPHFAEAYGSLFGSTRRGRHWWLLVDMGISIVAGLIATVPAIAVGATGDLPHSVCSGALYAVTVVQLLAVALFAYLRPTAVRWELLLTGLMYVLAAVSAVLASISTSSTDDAKNDIGALQLVVSLGLLVGSAAECIVVLLVCGRRRSIVSSHARFEEKEAFTVAYDDVPFDRCQCPDPAKGNTNVRRNQHAALHTLVVLICKADPR
jgi:hypothetical protein